MIKNNDFFGFHFTIYDFFSDSLMQLSSPIFNQIFCSNHHLADDWVMMII